MKSALDQYWQAVDPKQKQKAVRQINGKKPSFDTLFQKLKEGRPYSSRVKRGFVKIRQPENFPPWALAFIPKDYNPAKKYPVRIFLHGLVSTMSPNFLFTNVVDTTSE